MRGRHDIAARNEIAELAQWFGTLIDHQIEEAARQEKRCHALFLDCGADRVEAEQARRWNNQFGAVEQCAPNLKNRSIEGQGRGLQEDLIRRKLAYSRDL